MRGSLATAPSEVALVAEVRRGDEEAFRRLTEPHARAVQVHCYRMLGSLHEAEDLLQETLLRAWCGLEGFEGRSSFRAWLYRIATNACLDALDKRARRILPHAYGPPADPNAPPALAIEETVWVEPYPDSLLDSGDPASRYESLESIELAFIVAAQRLSPRQRAVLLLRDVLGFSAREAADALATSVASVNSSLQKARDKLERDPPDRHVASSPEEAAALGKYVRAWEEADVEGLVALLREDATMTMPPTPSWYAGRAAIGAFFSNLFAGDLRGRLQLVPTRANRQPALAVYLHESDDGHSSAFALMVLTLRRGEILTITGFTNASLLSRFLGGRSFRPVTGA